MTSYDKYLNENNEFFYDEGGSSKSNSLKQDHELFDDDEYIAEELVQVRRVEAGKSEDWEVLVDGSAALVIRGRQLNAAERNFIRSKDGVMFVMNNFKQGERTASRLKALVKKKVSS